ncbi:MAG: hypothetical protein FJZ63_05940, partial [Chlamydiae bacterium]|nr:hypothetical protein [Chlamydiota bacterium]
MRKALLAFLLGTTCGYSLYLGSPSLPDSAVEGFFISKECGFGLKLGYQGDNVAHKSLYVTNSHVVDSIKQIHYLMQQGVITLNFVNRFELYGSLGEIQFHMSPKVNSSIQDVFATGNRFTWGFGGRGILFSFSKASLGLDFKYQLASPHFQWMTQNGAPLSPIGASKLRYREWQVGLSLAYQTDIFAPYLGAVYNQMEGQYRQLPSNILPGQESYFSM